MLAPSGVVAYFLSQYETKFQSGQSLLTVGSSHSLPSPSLQLPTTGPNRDPLLRRFWGRFAAPGSVQFCYFTLCFCYFSAVHLCGGKGMHTSPAWPVPRHSNTRGNPKWCLQLRSKAPFGMFRERLRFLSCSCASSSKRLFQCNRVRV